MGLTFQPYGQNKDGENGLDLRRSDSIYFDHGWNDIRFSHMVLTFTL